MDIAQLKEQIRAVAKARAMAKEALDAKTAARLLWESEHKDLIINAEETDRFRQLAEDNLRLMTLQAYAETGDKAPTEGVSVKLFQVLDYDPKEALKWAMEHQIALSLDKKSFEGFAKATPLDFVTISEEPRAQIATKLEVE